jgi:hypothetical protein
LFLNQKEISVNPATRNNAFANAIKSVTKRGKGKIGSVKTINPVTPDKKKVRRNQLESLSPENIPDAEINDKLMNPYPIPSSAPGRECGYG